MERKIRTLHVTCLDGTSFGGISSVLKSIYQNIDHSKFALDIVFPGKSTLHILDNEFRKNGDSFFELNNNIGNKIGKIRYLLRLRKIYKNNQYDIIHIHSGLPLFNYGTALVARMSTNSKIVIHNHNDVSLHNGIKKALYPFIITIMGKNADYFFSCSNKSAAKTIPKNAIKKRKYAVYINGINISGYKYNECKRKVWRRRLGISDDTILLGSVGRLAYQKNHEHEIVLLRKLNDIRGHKYGLVIVGAGDCKEKLVELAQRLDVMDSITWIDYSDDISGMMNAFDILLLASRYEGFGIVAIEAQANGLPVIASDVLPEETKITNNICYCSIRDEEDWIDAILDAKRNNEIIINDKYDIKTTVLDIEKVYRGLMGDKNAIVSVIVPVYNTPPSYLKKCISSIAKQKYKNIETIVVDDGSDAKYGYKYLEILGTLDGARYYKKKNGGVSSARNYGLSKCKGEYVLFLDSDDELTNDCIEKLMRSIGDNDVMVFSGKKYLETNTIVREVSVRKPKFNLNKYLVRNSQMIALHGTLFSRRFIDGSIFDEQMTIGEDTAFILNIMKVNGAGCYAVTGEPLCIYKKREGSALNTVSRQSTIDYINGINRLTEHYVDAFGNLVELDAFYAEKCFNALKRYQKSSQDSSYKKCHLFSRNYMLKKRITIMHLNPKTTYKSVLVKMTMSNNDLMQKIAYSLIRVRN